MVFGFSLFVFKTKEFTAKQKQNLSEKICGHKEVGYSAERKSGGRRMYGQEASLSSSPCYASGNKEIHYLYRCGYHSIPPFVQLRV